MNERDSIEKKLTRSFFKVASIMAIVSLMALIALIVISNRYSYALKNYGFAQGDIGKAMFEFADSRSSLRAAIGYDDEEAITTVVQQHNENKNKFKEYFAVVENTIVSEDGRETYDEISSELDAYWALDQKIMELGATTDRELCKQAQDIALQDLAPAYNSIYSKLNSLLEVKVTEGKRLSSVLTVTELILAAAIIVITAVSLTLSTKIGKQIAKGIASPLGKLGKRLKTFSTGDLTSPFPIVETGDEVEYMEKAASDMANYLNIIIQGISG
ncbi:MAG: MCP four helix bundle domain-containing protein, partial [Lachnospiraceae bacterium]|nr:MCP four helix bundle domain-containing protein [Lachnospiraceae bacterium]